MNVVTVFFAALTIGGYVIPLAILFAAAWAVIHTGRWVLRLTRAARQWQRDTRQDPAGSSISDAELADVIATWGEDIHKQQREEDR